VTILDTVSHSEEQTRRLGRRLGELLGPDDVVLLSGPLGSGKTRLAQGIALGLGIEDPVTSPTFALVHEYSGRMRLYHLDFYRMERPDEILHLGFEEYFYGGGVTVAEWPEQVVGLPCEHLLVRCKPISETKRGLRFEPHGARYDALVATVRTTAFLL